MKVYIPVKLYRSNEYKQAVELGRAAFGTGKTRPADDEAVLTLANEYSKAVKNDLARIAICEGWRKGWAKAHSASIDWSALDAELAAL